MSERTEDYQGSYICGRCKEEIFYLKSEGKKSQIPCPECDWWGGEKDYKKLPTKIKLDLTQY